MPSLMDGSIKTVWEPYKYGSPEDYYITQFNSLLQECSTKDILPFFDHTKKDIPENMLNRSIMKDINKVAAELHSASTGAGGNTYIFGKDALELNLSLDTTKNIRPLLVCADGKYSSIQPILHEMKVAESGAKTKYQFMYNLEQFDERSQKILKKVAKEYNQEKETNKIKNEIQKDAREFYKDNCKNPDNRKKMTNLLQQNREENKNLLSSFEAVMIHNLAQKHGGFEIIGDKYIKPENEIVAKMKMREEIDSSLKAIADNKLKPDALMRSVFKGQETANLIMSKDVSYDRSHEKHETIKAKTNTHKLEYGYGR